MKRIISVLTAVTLFVTCLLPMSATVSAASARVLLSGDVNADGSANMADVALAYRIVSGTTSNYNDGMFLRADTNGDFSLDMSDIMVLYAAIAGRRNLSDATPTPSSEAIALANYINAERQRCGLPTLVYADHLQVLANIRAVEQTVIQGGTRPNGESWYSIYDAYEVGNAVEGGETYVNGSSDYRVVGNYMLNSSNIRPYLLATEVNAIVISHYNQNWIVHTVLV